MCLQKLEPFADFLRLRVDQIAGDLAGNDGIPAIQIRSAPGIAPLKGRPQIRLIAQIWIQHSSTTQ